ncbi:hypothetical protein [Haliscomenobacter sp.]|uniref:hypothetical protein n=1 Tax=Haliscomenobacter sp. TaxID=2717303 RepID=UPI0035939C4E
MYTLSNDGDSFEKRYWNVFLKNDFPAYEKYWSKYIVPLTNRSISTPGDVHFKNSHQLLSEGYLPEDICKAQLHYTVLRRLGRAVEILAYLQSKPVQDIIDTDALAEGIFHVVAAQDVAFEFLQRMSTPNKYDPWVPNNHGNQTRNNNTSEDAQREWRKNNNHPLGDIRNYRNTIAHGRVLPSTRKNNKIMLPNIGKEQNYLDWRLLTDGNGSINNNDFDIIDEILRYAWTETIQYCSDEWEKLSL